MITSSLYITIGGEAGDGILSAGEILCKIFFEAGSGLATYKNFPSRIRGGHTSYSIRVADNFCNHKDCQVDILLAFDEESFAAHNHELKKRSIVIYDSTKIKNPVKVEGLDITYYDIPISDLAVKNFGKSLYKNTILVGFIAAMLDIDMKYIEKGFSKAIKDKKGDEIYNINMNACNFGINFYKNELKGRLFRMPKANLSDTVLMTGNECVTLGALAAGCRFAAAYPISPATEIFEAMCSYLPKNGGTALQTEDEIAALCAAIGAGFAGVRAMTSTSGPGFSLMAEAIGLSGCAEVPVVIIDVQRAGPSTGLPTKTEQSEFYHALFSSHGDFPRIVLVAGDASQCFDFTVKAFNLAEVFQCPVIMMSEQSIGQNKTVMPKLDFSNVVIDRGKLLSDKELAKAEQKFIRYKFTEDGVSPRAIPSQVGGVHLASGNEHLESGRITEDPDIRVKIMDKRQMKLSAAAVSKHLPKPLYFGDDESKLGIITIGHNTSVTLEALDILKLAGGPNFAMMQLTALMPFPAEEVVKFAGNREKIFVIENNKAAQISNIIKMHAPIHNKLHSILKYNGVAFSPKEIAARLSEVK